MSCHRSFRRRTQNELKYHHVPGSQKWKWPRPSELSVELLRHNQFSLCKLKLGKCLYELRWKFMLAYWRNYTIQRAFGKECWVHGKSGFLSFGWLVMPRFKTQAFFYLKTKPIILSITLWKFNMVCVDASLLQKFKDKWFIFMDGLSRTGTGPTGTVLFITHFKPTVKKRT